MVSVAGRQAEPYGSVKRGLHVSKHVAASGPASHSTDSRSIQLSKKPRKHLGLEEQDFCWSVEC